MTDAGIRLRAAGGGGWGGYRQQGRATSLSRFDRALNNQRRNEKCLLEQRQYISGRKITVYYKAHLAKHESTRIKQHHVQLYCLWAKYDTHISVQHSTTERHIPVYWLLFTAQKMEVLQKSPAAFFA